MNMQKSFSDEVEDLDLLEIDDFEVLTPSLLEDDWLL